MNQARLTTNRLTLRQPRHEDWTDIHTYMKDGSVQQYMPKTPTQFSEEHAKNKVASLQSLNDQDDANAWVIEHDEDEHVIGIIDENILPQHRKARLGYHISPDYQRRGLMTEAVETVIAHGFNDQNVHKFTAEIAAENKPSKEFIESIGFTQEGTLRGELFIKGKFHDIIHYGLLKQEWRHDG